MMQKIETFTIGQLAKAAGVGVETVRYYQRRKLLPVPASSSSFRHYSSELVQRIRFIKRAQELGFSLDEIAQLLSLEDGDDRAAIRQLAGERLHQVRAKLADLTRMATMLEGLIDTCAHHQGAPQCPIIQALAETP